MGWIRKHGRKVKNKLKKFFNTKVGKAVGLIGLGFILPQAWAFLTKSTMPQWGAWYGIGGPKGFFGTGLGKAPTGSAVSQSAAGTVTEKSTLLDKTDLTKVVKPEKISEVVIDSANTAVANGTNIISPDVSGAVTQSIEHTYGIEPTKWETLTPIDQEAIRNLSTPGYNIDATTGIESFRVKPTSLKKTPEQLYETIADEPAKDAVLGVHSGETEKAAMSAKKKLPEKLTGVKDFSKSVGEGVTMAVLTDALMGDAKQDLSQSLGIQGSPPVEGPQGAFIRDVSSNFVQNGGRPLTFNQYFEMGMPMYGPYARRNIAVNDRIKTPYSGL